MAAEPTPPASEYDLGNTELDLTQPDGLPVADSQGRLHDPKTGQFLPDQSSASPVPPVEGAAAVSPAAPSHPSSLLSTAVDLGFTQADFEEMSTPALTRAVHAAMRAQQSEKEHWMKAGLLDHARAAPEPAPSPAPEPDIDLGIDEEQYDPKIVAAFKKVHKAKNDEIKALKDEVRGLGKGLQDREAARSVQLLDGAFSRLEKDCGDMFGKGAMAELIKTDPDAAFRRQALVKNSGLDLANLNPFTLVDQLRSTLKRLRWTAKAAEPNPYEAEPASRITPEQWRNGTVAKPTQRAGAAEPPGDLLEAKNRSERARKHGIVQEGDGDTLDTLLG